MREKRIAWAVTGAGHVLEECVEALLKYERVDLFLSRAATEVLRMYDLDARIGAVHRSIYREDAASAPHAARFFTGAYSVYVVAPATSNSVAKFVHGISDTLVTNLFAQAGKARVPILVYPTDLDPEMKSFGPHREPIRVYPRPIDLQNTEKLRNFAGTKIVRSREELERCLAACL
jgi:dihydromethanopterin reductase (acceptor)